MVSPFYSLMQDGYSSRITLTSSGIVFYEKSVTPPSFEVSGEAIDVTTAAWGTEYNFSSFVPAYMKKNEQAQTTVAYDPALYFQIAKQVNVNQAITVTFPNTIEHNSNVVEVVLGFQGWLRSFSPGAISLDEQPQAQVTFVVSNWEIPISSSQNVSTLISPPTTL